MLSHVYRLNAVACLCALLSSGCDDTTDTTGMVGNGQPGSILGGAMTPMSPQPGLRNGQPRPSTPDLGTIMPPTAMDAALMATTQEPCEPVGATRCLSQGEGFRQRCNAEGQWALEGCPNGAVCQGMDCVSPPEQCNNGETKCLSATQIGICENEQWVVANDCPDGQGCANGVCAPRACAAAEASRSYLGCDYLAVDLPNAAFDPNAGSTRDSPLGVVLGNPDSTSPIKVSVSGPDGQLANLVGQTTVSGQPMGLNPIPPRETIRSEVRDANDMVIASGMMVADDLEVPAGGTAVLLLPRRMGPLRTSSVQKNAYRVRSSAPVVLYQFSPYCCNFSVSNDASLLFPTSALGTNYRYVGAPYTNQNPAGLEAPPVISVVAPSDNTQVTVTLPTGSRVDISGSQNIVQNGDVYEATLNAQDVLLLTGTLDGAAEDDLTGADIVATQPVAVFTTHVCTSYPETTAACDHLQEQLLPISAWGGGFLLVPPKLRGMMSPFNQERTYWKIIGTDRDTQIRFTAPFADLNPQRPGFADVPYCGDLLAGGDTVVLRAGEYCEFGTTTPAQINADGPIMILGFLSGQDSAIGSFLPSGDPSVFVLPPERQLRRDYVFLTPATYANDFLTITTPPDNMITLDGQPVDLSDATPVLGSPYLVKHVPLPRDGSHTIVGQTPFGILVYAYDNYVSYAYTGGLNLSKR